MSGGGALQAGHSKSEQRGGTQEGASQLAMQMANQFFGETGPLRQDFTSLLQNALTGDTATAARLPIVASAMEASRKQGAQAMAGTEEELARTGLAGTPFGENIRSNTRANQEFQTSQIPSQFLGQLLNMIPGYVQGQGQTAMGVLPGLTYQKGDSWAHNWGMSGQGGAK
jgi:hypothetical protein